MSIVVIGINHKTAPVDLREKAYFAPDKLPLYLQDLLGRGGAMEALLISTCNRSELYCHTDNIPQARDWFFAQTSLSPEDFAAATYTYYDEEAVAHMMKVASGLDSMILGEPQILGQLKTAFSESCAVSAIGPLFHRLFQQIFAVAKEIRTTTAIGACPVSVASSAVHFAKQHIPHFTHAQVLLIGAGDTTELLLRYLRALLTKPIAIANRSLEKAEILAADYNGKAYAFDELKQAMLTADVVFSATGSPVPLIQEALVADIMQMRGHKPLLLVDIAVPRDIDASVANVPNVQLHCIDDLKAIIEQNRQGREHAALKAHELIREKSNTFVEEMKTLDKVTHTIRAYRSQIEEICRVELKKAKQQLQQGGDPVEALEAFAHAFTKKMLHTPSVQLRQAGAEGRLELLRLAKQLFAIPDPEVERL